MKWKKIRHDKMERNLPDAITWQANLPFDNKLTIRSHPYGYGAWTIECRELGIGGKYAWLDTKDENEAKKKAEQIMKKWAEHWIALGQKILSNIDK